MTTDVIPELVRIAITNHVFRYEGKHYMVEEFESGECWWWIFSFQTAKYERVRGKGTVDLLNQAYAKWKETHGQGRNLRICRRART